MLRFETIESARETFAYADEDIEEAASFIDKSDNLTAYHMLKRMTDDLESAANAFPEMQAELDVIAQKITPVLMRIVHVKS